MKAWMKQFNPLAAKGWQAQLAVSLVLLFVLLLATALVWQIYSGLKITGVVDKVSETIKPHVKKAAVENARVQIKKSEIFGQHKAPEKVRVNTDLILMGILKAKNKENSRAIIAKKGKEENVYAAGERISNGLTVYRIYDEKVVVSRYGTKETLYLNWEDKGVNKPARSYSKPAKKDSEAKPKYTSEKSKEMAERWKNLREMRWKYDSGSLMRLRKNSNPEKLEEIMGRVRESGRFPSFQGGTEKFNNMRLQNMQQ